MNIQHLISEYLSTVNIMQLATCQNNKTWSCNLHFYADDDFNIYWLSTENTRHSLDIKANPSVSAAFMVHEDTPKEKYVIGVSVEGVATQVSDSSEKEKLAEGYKKKLGTSDKFMSDVVSGANPHKFYKLSPECFVLFDNKSFPDKPRQEWKIEK